MSLSARHQRSHWQGAVAGAEGRRREAQTGRQAEWVEAVGGCGEGARVGVLPTANRHEGGMGGGQRLQLASGQDWWSDGPEARGARKEKGGGVRRRLRFQEWGNGPGARGGGAWGGLVVCPCAPVREWRG